MWSLWHLDSFDNIIVVEISSIFIYIFDHTSRLLLQWFVIALMMKYKCNEVYIVCEKERW
jgi:hypothetical protein